MYGIFLMLSKQVPHMHAIPPRTKTIYFWQVRRNSKLSMLYKYKEAKQAKTVSVQTAIIKPMKTPEVQRKIVKAIKSNTVDTMDFSNGVLCG